MQALQYTAIGVAPEIREVATPEPGPGEVLLRMTAAGVCHSDEYFMGLPAEDYGMGLPLTLGHEGAGVVAGLGAGVRGVREGDAVVVYGAWGCGMCRTCATGAENYCLNEAEFKIEWPGLGAPGCMAEYMLVPSPRHLVPLGDLDPVANVPLTDAGLTPYHAVRRSWSKLPPGSAAVVIGVGGLGHLAVQILRATTAARVLAVDTRLEARELALGAGADLVVAPDDDAVATLRAATGGRGADVVLDFVGAESTSALGAAVTRFLGDVTVVGIAGGTFPFSFFSQPYEVSIQTTYWGSRPELVEVLDLAARGLLRPTVSTVPLEGAVEAYHRLAAGTALGRQVVVPSAAG